MDIGPPLSDRAQVTPRERQRLHRYIGLSMLLVLQLILYRAEAGQPHVTSIAAFTPATLSTHTHQKQCSSSVYKAFNSPIRSSRRVDSRLPNTSLGKQSSDGNSPTTNSFQIRLTSVSKQAKANLIVVSKAIQSNWGFGPEYKRATASQNSTNKWGTKGELYVASQWLLTLCAISGKIPVLGSLISFLLGPALVLLGVGTYYLAITDFGFVETLSPWPIIVPSSTMLVSNKNGDAGKLLNFGSINGNSADTASEKFDRPLITDGRVYTEMRHPIYASLLYIMAGLSIWSNSAMRLFLTAGLYLVLDRKADMEERELMNDKKFRKQYEVYKDRVKGKFVPERYTTRITEYVVKIAKSIEDLQNRLKK